MILSGKRVLVVGGAEGVGFAVASQFAGKGALVTIASRSKTKLAAAVIQIPNAQSHIVDLEDNASIELLLADAGPIDHLIVTSRQRIAPHKVTEISLQEAIRAFHVKFWGALALVQKAARCIPAGGSITLTSGTAGLRAYPGQTVNAAINAATEALCRVLAVELAPIRVNVVSPDSLKRALLQTNAIRTTFETGRSHSCGTPWLGRGSCQCFSLSGRV
jgi:NAD(P)-dependent dehydrogenase (short-subunit alcohol dehydrogenase family)